MGSRLRIECLHCGAKMVTERFFWNPGRITVTCCGPPTGGCERLISVTLTTELLAAAEFADSVAENALD